MLITTIHAMRMTCVQELNQVLLAMMAMLVLLVMLSSPIDHAREHSQTVTTTAHAMPTTTVQVLNQALRAMITMHVQ